jgi:type VI secretion system secreted protein Hcp
MFAALETTLLDSNARRNPVRPQQISPVSNSRKRSTLDPFFPTEVLIMAAYIKFDGVDGEAQDKDHKNWSDLASVSQGLHQPGGGATGATRRRGDVIMDDVMCVKELDKASPKIAESICNGKVFPKVEIHLTASTTDAGRVTYYAYDLKNVLVTSYSISGAGQSEDVPMESFSLNFEEIRVTYTEVDAKGKKKGNVEYSWKVEEGEK